jgi:serine O-acetyltransferase
MPYQRYAPLPAGEQPGLGRLLLSDCAAHYGDPRAARGRHLLLVGLRYLTNPSLHATLLVRLITHTPRWTTWVWRNLLVAKHGMDIHPDIRVGPGLVFPHPMGVVIGPGVVLGRDVTIFQNVTLGARRRHTRAELAERRVTPHIGDEVHIFTGSVVVGPITIGSGTTVGANSYVDTDVPPHSVLRGGGGPGRRGSD